jgi:23S rRNA (cytidine2498-2'-O)-methyltransferase
MKNADVSDMDHLILSCRAGFETECGAEIEAAASVAGVRGRITKAPHSGYVIFTPSEKNIATLLFRKISFDSLIFSRQMIGVFSEITGLPQNDRIGPIIAALKTKSLSVNQVSVETADAEATKPILPFCASFSHHFTKAIENEGWLASGECESGLRLHLFFLTSDRVYAGVSDISNSSPWYMGIPRLKFPREAPSRSTLKLEEAFLVFLTEEQRNKLLRPGLQAVDLGAAPGGWTYQLVRRGMRVTAVDNGAMDPAIMQSGLVKHFRADGFGYKPAKPVDWMVCDIVEQPARIAKLAGQWMAGGWCRHAIFNLKLPMKKRYEEALRCKGIIEKEMRGSGVRFELRFKQLYHDREEVTGFLTRR